MFTTERLHIELLSFNDNSFILELVNTPGWLEFIGNRNVYTTLDTQKYIQKILDNKDYTYWVVKRNEDNLSIGLISLIKRDYLEYHDIGFAFLPSYTNLGYAYEATNEIINNISQDKNYKILLATTLLTNNKSIKLLSRLGFVFDKVIKVQDEKLNLYKRVLDKS
jgi:RimJ/RimL family protein N-acetyltransferase